MDYFHGLLQTEKYKSVIQTYANRLRLLLLLLLLLNHLILNFPKENILEVLQSRC